MVNYELMFAQEHKDQSVQDFYRCARRGLDTGEPTSWNTEIDSRGFLGVCSGYVGAGTAWALHEKNFFHEYKKLLDTQNRKTNK